MRQFVGDDGYRRFVYNGETYTLADVFHYQYLARKEAKQYPQETKVCLVDGGSAKGCYGIWIKEPKG